MDDDDDSLAQLRLFLRDEDLECSFYSDPKKALEDISENSHAVVLSDVKMPGMNGIEFLKEVGKISPLTSRINMSNFSTTDTVMQAINESHIYDFLKKPLKKGSLIGCLRKAVERFNVLLDRDNLSKLLALKNAELSEINDSLDDKIQLQNLELNLRDRILQHLAGVRPVAEPWNLIGDFVSAFFRGRGAFAAYLARGKSFQLAFSLFNPPIKIAKDWEMELKDEEPFSLTGDASGNLRKNIKLPFDYKSFYPFALSRFHHLLGVTFLASEEEVPMEKLEGFKRLVPLVSLLAYDQLAVEHLDELTEKIEKVDLMQ